MGLAPSGCRCFVRISRSCEVPVPIFSQPLRRPLLIATKEVEAALADLAADVDDGVALWALLVARTRLGHLGLVESFGLQELLARSVGLNHRALRMHTRGGI